jgi:hypothetical protein
MEQTFCNCPFSKFLDKTDLRSDEKNNHFVCGVSVLVWHIQQPRHKRFATPLYF